MSDEARECIAVLTREEAEAQAKAAAINEEMRRTRLVLDADMLHSLISPRAHLEVEIPHLGAYMYSIDGVLNGKKITGAVFAGECMLVFAPTESQAQEIANAGLRKTVELLEGEYRTRELRLSPTMQGLSPDAAGRRAAEEQRPLQGRAAEQREMLRNIMADAFAKAAQKR